jgi:hypothetical protein
MGEEKQKYIEKHGIISSLDFINTLLIERMN